MNINDFKHPAARQVDEMILSGASAKDVMDVISNLRLSEVEVFCKSCLFMQKLFLPDFVWQCSRDGVLESLTSLVAFVSLWILKELKRHEKRLQGRGLFWEAVDKCCGDLPRGLRHCSRVVKCFDHDMDELLLGLNSPLAGYDWIFEHIGNRARDGIKVLSQSRWRSRIYQLDVFLSVSEENAWLMLQALPSMPKELLLELAKQAFLAENKISERLDRLKGTLWQTLSSPAVRLPLSLRSCVGSILPPESCADLHLCCSMPLFKDHYSHGANWTPELERYSENDSVVEMKMGVSITGREVKLGDLEWFLYQIRPQLMAHYLMALGRNLSRADVSRLVTKIMIDWMPDGMRCAFDVIELLFPGHIRSIKSCCGENLLIYSVYDWTCAGQSFLQDKHRILLDMGCDPDEKCLMGYSWNDIQRWEGKKCASR